MTDRAPAAVAVIGGGIVGSAIAWALGCGGHRVHWLVDSGPEGSGTAAAGAMLAVHSEVIAHDDPLRRDRDAGLRAAGRSRWDEWLPRLREASGHPVPLDHGIHVVGTAGADDVDGLAAIRAAARATGAVAQDLVPRDVPGLDSDPDAGIADAVYLPGEASVDSGVLLAALRSAIGTLANVSVAAERVQRVEPGADGVRVTCASGTTVAVDEVVVAAGVETGRLLADSDLPQLVAPIFSGRGVSLVVRTDAALTQCLRTPNRAFACGLHLVPRGPSTMYLGATNRMSTQPEPGAAPRLDEIVELVRGSGRELQIGLRRAELMAATVGHRAVTLDRTPLVGRTHDPRVLVATALWRNGVVLAPLVADLVSAELEQPGSTAAHPFAPTRDVRARPLDQEALRRAARGIVAGFLDGARLAPGRLGELTAFVENSLADGIVDGATGPSRTVQRLLDRAPMEEVLPMVYDLSSRRR